MGTHVCKWRLPQSVMVIGLNCSKFFFGRQGCPSFYVGFILGAIRLICGVARLLWGALRFVLDAL